jgi:hypothetical protein
MSYLRDPYVAAGGDYSYLTRNFSNDCKKIEVLLFIKNHLDILGVTGRGIMRQQA